VGQVIPLEVCNGIVEVVVIMGLSNEFLIDNHYKAVVAIRTLQRKGTMDYTVSTAMIIQPRSEDFEC
jgi:hypothetical protein